MRRFPMIDGLRLLAAGLVLVSHVAFWTGASGIDVSGPLLARGDSGVAVFFAISAFLLLRPYFGRDVDLRRYVVHRAARILPAYFVALAAVWLVLFLRTGSVGGAIDVVAHLFLLQGYTGADYQAFTQTWSLTTEVTFYALVPFVGPVLARLARRDIRRTLLLLAAVALVGVLAQALATAGTAARATTWPGVLATSVIGHASWFAAGATLAVLMSGAGRTWLTGRVPAPSASMLFSTAALTYLLASLPWAGPVDLTAPTVSQAIVKEVLYTAFAFLALAAATRPAGDEAAERVHRSPALRLAGDLSYAVFLWHVLVLQVLYLVAGWPLFAGGFGWMLFAVVTVTGMIAYASALLIEQPVMNRWASKPTTAPDDGTVLPSRSR